MRVHDDWGERARSAEAQFDAEHFSAWRRWREREGGAAFEWSGAPVVFREEEYESCFELYVKCADAWGEAKKLASDWRKAERRCRNYLENETRVRFGHNKIGDHWVGETILYHIVSRLLPERRVERHVRPDWLEGLELDIYVEELALAFEYQGIQHYEPVQHFGGEEAFIRQQKRDARKVQLCAKRDVRLIHIRYSDDLSDTYVQGRIDDVIAADN
jgi:hypothetical protein